MTKNADADIQATVEEGILVGNEASGDFLLEREMNLRKVKREEPNTSNIPCVELCQRTVLQMSLYLSL